MTTINGTENDDMLLGSSGADIIFGRGGNDQLLGLSGNDQLIGGGGADTLGGGAGLDVLRGEAGDDILGGGRDADILEGGAGTDTASYVGSLGGVSVNLATGKLFGGDAEGDVVSGIENVTGTSFDDLITGNGLANALSGGAGADLLDGGHGDDLIDGGDGADRLDGGGDSDTVSYLASTEGIGVNLLLNSGGGGDTLIAIENADGSLFRDFLHGDNLDNRLRGFDGDDQLKGFDGSDGLEGGTGADTLLGGAGIDTLDGGAGSDVLNGEAGLDTVTYASSSAGVQASLNPSDGAGEGGEAQGDRLFNVENLTGSDFGDFLAGNAGRNVLTGGKGPDFLIGDGGNDAFIFSARSHAGDSIADFSNVAGNNDVLHFEGDSFGRLADGALAAGRFVANASGQATTAAQRFVYDTDSGVLSFDANGSGAGGVTEIVQLAGAPTLTLADILIV